MKIILLAGGYYVGVWLRDPWLDQRESMHIGSWRDGEYFPILGYEFWYDDTYPKYVIFNFGDE